MEVSPIAGLSDWERGLDGRESVCGAFDLDSISYGLPAELTVIGLSKGIEGAHRVVAPPHPVDGESHHGVGSASVPKLWQHAHRRDADRVEYGVSSSGFHLFCDEGRYYFAIEFPHKWDVFRLCDRFVRRKRQVSSESNFPNEGTSLDVFRLRLSDANGHCRYATRSVRRWRKVWELKSKGDLCIIRFGDRFWIATIELGWGDRRRGCRGIGLGKRRLVLGDSVVVVFCNEFLVRDYFSRWGCCSSSSSRVSSDSERWRVRSLCVSFFDDAR